MRSASVSLFPPNTQTALHAHCSHVRIPRAYIHRHKTTEETKQKRAHHTEHVIENFNGSWACGNDPMMTKAIILGIVQGLTEFLPISSSGHLAILENYFGIADPVALATFLHFGTFCATVVFFIKPIGNIIRGCFKGDKQNILYVVYIIVGTIPILVFVILFRTYIEESFKDIRLVALLFGITGVVLLMTSVVRKVKGKVSLWSAIIMGIGQMFAVFPGISRSGFTISAGIFSRVSPKNAFTFSFLLSLPAVLCANFLKLNALSHTADASSIVIGILCSFVSGLIALKILKTLVQRWFYLFGIYCLIISVILLLLQ